MVRYVFKLRVIGLTRDEVVLMLLGVYVRHDGKLFGDKGYLSHAVFRHVLRELGVLLITQHNRNVVNQLVPLADTLLLRKRAIIEIILDQFKNISQLEHTFHRSPVNFVVNLFAGLVAYCHQPKKPSLQLQALSRLEVDIPN